MVSRSRMRNRWTRPERVLQTPLRSACGLELRGRRVDQAGSYPLNSPFRPPVPLRARAAAPRAPGRADRPAARRVAIRERDCGSTAPDAAAEAAAPLVRSTGA